MNKKKLKIAFLGNQIAWGGGAKSLLYLIKSLSNLDNRLYLFVTHCASLEMKKEFELYVEFVKIINLPEVTSAQTQSLKDNLQKVNESIKDSLVINQFADELSRLKIDILHINNSVFSAVYKTIKTRTSVKIVSHIREWIDWNGVHQKQRYIIDNISNYSDAIICISDNEAQVFKNFQNLSILPNPFDFRELESIANNKGSLKSAIGFDESSIIVGMMGRTQVNKGFLDFLKVLSYLKKNYTDVENIKFIILGGKVPDSFNIILYLLRKLRGKSTFTFDVYNYIKKENLHREVYFLGNRKDILEIVSLFDIAVRPSYSGDPWGRDIIEYMALRKPIVATGSSEFYIKNGETGFLLPPRDIVQMAEKIYWLFKNKTEAIQMGKRAYEQVFTMCDFNEFRIKVLQIYNTLIPS
jgi:glycosyltransferase involved in cell wall biosynthesis